MSDEVELEITPNGRIRTIYKDGRQHIIDAMKGHWQIKRASNVEWERIYSNGQTYEGWTVRSAHLPDYCYLRRHPMNGSIEVTTNGHGLPSFFPTREEALREEVKHFFELLPKENS